MPALVTREPVPTARLASLMRQGGWYIIAGAGATAINAVLFLLLREPLGAYAANLSAIVITTVANTEFHRRVTFDGQNSRRGRRVTAISLTVVFYAGYSSAALLILYALVANPTAVQQALSIVSATVLGGIARFTLLRAWVFSPSVTSTHRGYNGFAGVKGKGSSDD